MADGKLKFTITVDGNGNAIIKDMNGNIQKVQKTSVAATSKMSKGFAGLWKQMAGAGLAIAGFVALKRAIADVVTDVIVFEKEFANVTTLLDSKGIQSAKMMEEGLLDMAGALGSAEELTKGLYQTLSAGVPPGVQAMEFLEASAKFAKAGLIDMATSVDVLSTVVNAYGFEASEAARISDVLFQVIKDGKITGQELAASLGKVIPTANTLGIGLEEVSAAIAVMTKAGIPAAESVTFLNSAMVQILKPASEASKVAKQLGLDFSKAGIRDAQGFQKWLVKVKEAVGDNETAMVKLFPNIRAMQAVFTLTGTSAGEYADQMVRMNKVTDNVNIAFEKQISTFAGVKSAIENKMSAALTKVLLPALQDLAKWLKDNEDELISAFEGIIGVLERIGKLAAFIGKGWKALFDLIKTPANEAEIAMKKVDAKLLDIASTRADIYRGSKLGFFDQKVLNDSIKGMEKFKEEQKEFGDLREKHKKIEKEIVPISEDVIEVVNNIGTAVKEVTRDYSIYNKILADNKKELDKLIEVNAALAEGIDLYNVEVDESIVNGKGWLEINGKMAGSVIDLKKKVKTGSDEFDNWGLSVGDVADALSLLGEYIEGDFGDVLSGLSGVIQSIAMGDFIGAIAQSISVLPDIGEWLWGTDPPVPWTEEEIEEWLKMMEAAAASAGQTLEEFMTESFENGLNLMGIDYEAFLKGLEIDTKNTFGIISSIIAGTFDAIGNLIGPGVTPTAPEEAIKPGTGFTTGGSFIIPPGYNENFQLGNIGAASSGEEVTITPANQVGNGGGDVYQVTIPTTIYADSNDSGSDIMDKFNEGILNGDGNTMQIIRARING